MPELILIRDIHEIHISEFRSKLKPDGLLKTFFYFSKYI